MVVHSNVIGITLQDALKWPKGNYDAPPQHTWMPIYAGTLYAVGSVMVGMRVWLRAAGRAGGFGSDDALMVLAWLGSTAFLVATLLVTERYGADRPVWDIRPQNFVNIALLIFILEETSLITQCCIKVSILLLYRRLFAADGSLNKWFLVAIRGGIFAVVAYTTAYVLLLIFDCRPSNAFWKAFDFEYEMTADYTCLSTGATVINITNGIFAGVTDLFVIFLPWTMTQSLGLPRRQLLALNFVFSLGLLATAASAARTYFLYQIGVALDITGSLFFTIVWAYLEIQLGIMCACVPAFRVFFRYFIWAPVVEHSSYLSSRFKGRQDFDELALRTIGSNSMHKATNSDASYGPEGKFSVTDTGRVVMGPTSPISPTNSVVSKPEGFVVRTPGDYEAWNARTIEHSRRTVIYQDQGPEELAQPPAQHEVPSQQ